MMLEIIKQRILGDLSRIYTNCICIFPKKRLKILIIEDEEGLRDSIAEYFGEAGNICETANDYQTAIAKISLYFIANKDKVVSKNAIAEHLWGDSFDLTDNFDFIYSHIKNIRKKLIEAGANDYIEAAYGMGYKFTDK
jgi:DNA-binding response OmpR family regulator